MTRTKEPAASSTIPTVSQLLAQRAQILGWLARLDEERDAENQRVVDRIRSDYQQRLHDVVQELSAHVGAIRSELSGASERHQQADARFLESEDALYEARLRHRIGELSADHWQARRGELERAVEQAAAERDEALTEVRRLEDVLSQIEGGAEDGAGSFGTGASDSVAGSDGTVPAEVTIDIEQAARPLAGSNGVDAEAAGLDQGLAFLEELDRAIASSAYPADSSEEGRDEEDEEQDEDLRPGKGAKCPECGYTNNADAWYCGVCGVDLA